VYFDNVGGDILDHALANLNMRARVVICGAISQYNETSYQGPKNYMSLLVNRARMEGMVIFDFQDRFMEAYADLGGWLATGKLKTKEHVIEGIETFPETLLRLFTGDKMGKLVLKV
jgi:NADPH-dependent curcumin reductase CurA